VQVGLNDFGGDKPRLFGPAVVANLSEDLSVLDTRAALIALDEELALDQGPKIAPVEGGRGTEAENWSREFANGAIGVTVGVALEGGRFRVHRFRV